MAADVCANENTAIPFRTPSTDFQVHGDGTISQHSTKLMWMQCSIGQSWDGAGCVGVMNSYHWLDALQMAESFSFAGYSDWRLPNKNELAAIIEERCWSPSVNTANFPDASDGTYWTSSPHVKYSTQSWSVHFFIGSITGTDKSSELYVRLVRFDE